MTCKTINSALFYVCNLARQNPLGATTYETIYASTNPADKEAFAEKIAHARVVKQKIEELCDPLEKAIFNFYYGFSDNFNGGEIDELAKFLVDKSESIEIAYRKHFTNLLVTKIIVRSWRDRFIRNDLELAAQLGVSDRLARYILAEAVVLTDILESMRLRFYHDDYVLASEIASRLVREGILRDDYV